MGKTKIVAIGNSLGIVLSKEVLARLRVEKGDYLHLVETPSGVELTPYDPLFASQLELVEGTAKDERNVLRCLGSD